MLHRELYPVHAILGHMPADGRPAGPLLTRRAGLLAAVLAPAALLAGGCTSGDAEPGATGTGPDGSGSTGTGSTGSGPSGSGAPADVAALAAAAESDLIALYDAAIATGPGEDRSLLFTALRDQHIAHREALGGASDAPAPTRAPDLGALITAERQAARDRIRSCVDADDPEIARVLALIAASEAAHVPALRQVKA